MGVVDIGSLTLENGAVARRRVDRRAALGRAVARPRQRRGGAARADRRLAHHRTGRTRTTRHRAGGTASSAPARRSTPTAGARSPPTCSAAAAARPARVRSRRDGKPWGSRFPRSPCATRWRPTSPRWPRSASPRSPRSSAARWAAPARWSGWSAIPTRSAPALVLAVGRTRDRRPDRHPEHAGRRDQGRPELAGRRLLRHRPRTRRSAWRSPAGSHT